MRPVHPAFRVSFEVAVLSELVEDAAQVVDLVAFVDVLLESAVTGNRTQDVDGVTEIGDPVKGDVLGAVIDVDVDLGAEPGEVADCRDDSAEELFVLFDAFSFSTAVAVTGLLT